MYDNNNIFALIIRKELPCKQIYENNFVLAFHDLHPQAKIHAIIVPKGPYTSIQEFSATASNEEIIALSKSFATIATMLGLENGYRLITNCRTDGGQEIEHLHYHMIGGSKLGPMVCQSKSNK